MSDLLPCPFCGGAPYSAQHGERYSTIGCNECSMEFSEDETEFGYKWPDALAAWNRRAIDVDALLRVAEEMEAWNTWTRNPHVEQMPGALSFGNLAAAIRKAVGK